MNLDAEGSATQGASWLFRALRRAQPHEGYAVLLLAWAAVFLPPLAVQSGELLQGAGPAQWVASVALVSGWLLARTRLRGWLAAVVLALFGLIASLYWGVYVLRFGPLVRQAGAWIAWALGGWDAPAPAMTYWADQGELLTTFVERTRVWLAGVWSGQGGVDNLVVLFFAGLLAWGVAAWAGWWIARHGQAFVALLPSGILLAQLAYWAPDTLWAAVLFIVIATLLIVLTRLAWCEAEWEREGVDYAEDIRLDVFLTGLALSLLILSVAPTVPSIASGELSRRFWSVFESPYRRAELQVSRSFESVRPVRSLIPPTGAAEGGLPRVHLLGGAPALGQQTALRVAVRGDTRGLQLYWRGQTYAVYTGRGWEDPAGVVRQRFDAGRPWNDDAGLPAGARTLVSTIEVVEASRAVIYGPAEPLGVDRPYRAFFRAPGELIALAPISAAPRYTVLSRALSPTPAALRAAQHDYAAEISALYLQLPDSISASLRTLAAEWTAAAATPYDTAIAIERELRKIPYSLDLPLPPPGRELVSWFIFDLHEGYCDYYASAMVVLARLRGIPARLAIGYATGEFDAASGRYVVTELNAHSWPELYFPGIGWVPFEPTAARPLAAQRSGADLDVAQPDAPASTSAPLPYAIGLAQLETTARTTVAEDRRREVKQGVMLGLNGLTLVWALWLVRSSRARPAVMPGAAQADFDRLLRWPGRVGVRVAAGATPREVVTALIREGEAIADGARIGRAQAASAAGVLREEALRLVGDVETELYAPERSGSRAPSGVGRLIRALRRLRYTRLFRI